MPAKDPLWFPYTEKSYRWWLRGARALFGGGGLAKKMGGFSRPVPPSFSRSRGPKGRGIRVKRVRASEFTRNPLAASPLGMTKKGGGGRDSSEVGIVSQ